MGKALWLAGYLHPVRVGMSQTHSTFLSSAGAQGSVLKLREFESQGVTAAKTAKAPGSLSRVASECSPCGLTESGTRVMLWF